MAYQCEVCGASFPKLSQLKQHQRTENHWKKYECDKCGKIFTRKDNLDRHVEKHRTANVAHCEECGRVFSRPDSLQRHMLEKHQVGGGQTRLAEDVEESANGSVTKTLRKEDDPRDFYSISKVKEQRMVKFITTASTYEVSIKDLEVTEDVLSTLQRIFTAIFQDLTKGAKSEDLVRLVVQSPGLDYPIVIPFLKVTGLTADRFMSEVERVLQSNEDFVIDSGLILEVTLVDMPNGGARKHCKFVNMEKFLSDKKCIIQIKNDDDMCCARAIATAKAKLDKHEQWNSIRQGRSLQGKLALQLHARADVPLGKCGVAELKKFQEVLPNYQILVVSRDHFNAIIYSGPESEKKICLYFHDNHYDVITSIAAFLTKNYFCTKCQKGYDHKENHKCNNICHMCCKIHNDNSDEIGSTAIPVTDISKDNNTLICTSSKP